MWKIVQCATLCLIFIPFGNTYWHLKLDHRGVVVIITAQLQSTKPELSFAQVQVLLAACRRFEMVRTSDNGPVWK